MSTRLENLPITFFGSVMGLTGLSIAWLRSAEVFDFSALPGLVLLHFSAAWFLVLSALYLMKLLRYPSRVAVEFHHPVKVNFFPAFSISILLLGIGFLHLRPQLAVYLWWIGAGLHLLATLRILSTWLRGDFRIQTLNPAWFIPVVGTILVPVAGTTIASPEISWFFFATGFFHWIALFTVLVYRLIFHTTLPERLIPTLFILVAPPAVGFIALVKLSGTLGPAERLLYHFGLFTLLLLFSMLKRFARLPYYVSWWAYTFPLAAATLSTILMYRMSGIAFYGLLSRGLLFLASAVVALVLIKTLSAVLRGEICVEELPEP